MRQKHKFCLIFFLSILLKVTPTLSFQIPSSLGFYTSQNSNQGSSHGLSLTTYTKNHLGLALSFSHSKTIIESEEINSPNLQLMILGAPLEDFSYQFEYEYWGLPNHLNSHRIGVPLFFALDSFEISFAPSFQKTLFYLDASSPERSNTDHWQLILSLESTFFNQILLGLRREKNYYHSDFSQLETVTTLSTSTLALSSQLLLSETALYAEYFADKWSINFEVAESVGAVDLKKGLSLVLSTHWTLSPKYSVSLTYGTSKDLEPSEEVQTEPNPTSVGLGFTIKY